MVDVLLWLGVVLLAVVVGILVVSLVAAVIAIVTIGIDEWKWRHRGPRKP